MALTIDNIVNALRINRDDFDTLFQQTQVGMPDTLRRSLIGTSLEADDKQAFRAALAYAESQNFLDEFLESIVKESLEDGTIGIALKEAALSKNNDPSLQALTNTVRGFNYPEIRRRGMDEGIQWTAKVLVDNAPAGTAVLIGPHLLLTAWHVVHPLFIPAVGPVPKGKPSVIFRDQTWIPEPGSHTRLKIRFDETTFENKKPITIDAAEDWLLWACACHDDEMPNLPTDKTKLNGYWDYAIICLTEAPGLERKWAHLDTRAVVPKSKDTVFVFQHPNGTTLQLDDDEVGNVDPPIVPKYRFLHYANTAKGSSGGPCFDRSFLLFGLHQGEWYPEFNKADGEKQVVNRGVPILRIIEHMKAHGIDLPAPPPSMIRIWNLGGKKKFLPVVGTDSFQTLIWNAALNDTTRLITINGNEKSGKSFMLNVLAPMLPEGAHLKLIFEAAEYTKKDVIPLATMICERAGAPVPVFPSKDQSTGNNWLRDDVAGAVVTALNNIRNNRLVWICFKDLNSSKVELDQTQQFLLAFYEHLAMAANSWLRMILDGMQGQIPYSIAEYHEEFLVPVVSEEDISNFLKWAVNELELQNDFPPVALRAAAMALKKDYDRSLIDKPLEAKIKLVTDISEQIDFFLKASK